MKKFKKPQLVLLGIGGFLVVLLFLLPRTQGVHKDETVIETESTSDYASVFIGELDETSRAVLEDINKKIAAEKDPLEQINWFDSLSHFWESRGQMLMAADALSDIAKVLQDKPSHFIAGDKYFEAYQSDSTELRKVAIRKAIESYEKVRDLNPDDLEAATSLGVCYVEGAADLGEPPMKGIQMLRDVLTKDPKNVNALVNLGYFAVKSGQFDKAIERFEEVLQVEPDYVDAYLYLSDIYLKTGKIEMAIEQLEKYKSFLGDPEAVKQLENYIEKLKSSNV